MCSYYTVFMTALEKYIKELEADVVLDELNLKEAALMLPGKKAKWVSRLIIEKNNLNGMYKKRDEALKVAVAEIREESNVRLTTPTLEKAAERHPLVSSIDEEIILQKHIVDFLERVDKTMHSISFDVKNLVDLIKLETT